jgi:hypothetical protein
MEPFISRAPLLLGSPLPRGRRVMIAFGDGIKDCTG